MPAKIGESARPDPVGKLAMSREIGLELAEVSPDRPAYPVKRPRRFRLRIRDWLIAVFLMALVASGVAQIIGARRLQAERALVQALRMQEAVRREKEALIRRLNEDEIVLEKKLKEAEEVLKKIEERLKQREVIPKSHEGDFPDPDR